MFCPYFQVDSMYFPALEVNRYCFPMIMVYIVKIHIRDNERCKIISSKVILHPMYIVKVLLTLTYPVFSVGLCFFTLRAFCQYLIRISAPPEWLLYAPSTASQIPPQDKGQTACPPVL